MIDFIDLALVALLVAAVVLAVTMPRVRLWVGGIAAVVAGVLLGRRLAGEIDPEDEPRHHRPPRSDPIIPIPNPATDLTEELHDAHDTVDSLPADDLDAAWAKHRERARDD